MTAYEVLGVPETATDEEVRAALAKLLLQHHPDHGGDPPTYRLIIRVRDLLANPTDPGARRAYDERLRRKRARGAAASSPKEVGARGGAGTMGESTTPVKTVTTVDLDAVRRRGEELLSHARAAGEVVEALGAAGVVGPKAVAAAKVGVKVAEILGRKRR